MMRVPRPVIQRVLLGIFALVLASLAVVMANRWVTMQRQALEEERRQLTVDYQQPVEVIVAARDLPEGTTLSTEHLQPARVPEKFLQPYAVRTPNQLLGMVTVAPLAVGEQVLLNKVRRPEAAPTGTTLSGMMPQGKRAVTIGVDALTGVGGFVRPGDAVDLLWTVKLPGEGGQGEQVVTLTLFQHVPVMAIGTQLVGRKGERTTGAGGDSKSRDAFTVTLALTAQETSFLLFAREQGRVQLSLRSRADEAAQAVLPANAGTLNAYLSGQPGMQIEPSAAKPPRSVEVYKGLKRDIVFIEQQQ